MKSQYKFILIIVLSFFIFSCEEDLLNREYYKPMIYLKSGENNIFSYPHTLNDSVTTGYITVGSGGSMPLLNDILVKMEIDTTELYSYNYRNFGNEHSKYVHFLNRKRFVIPSFDIILKAGDESSTTFFPVEVDVNGLSPDSTYIIPVTIKSAENYEINKDKNYVLYKIELTNSYSSTSSRSYKMKGLQKPDGGIESNITTTKTLLPLTKNQVRLFPASFANSTDLKTILDRAIILIINDDNTVRIKPYGNIKIEQLNECYHNPEEKMFVLNYKMIIRIYT